MPRYPQPQQNDEPLRADLDAFFVGVDNRQDRNALPAGVAAEAVNMRFDRNYAATRPGTCSPLFCNKISHADDHPVFEWISLLKTAGVFSDPNGSEWILVANAGQVWRCGEGRQPQHLPLIDNGSVDYDDGNTFVQCFEQVILFRGADLPALLWNGQPQKPLRPIVGSMGRPRAAFLSPTPQADWGVVMADRLFVPISRDELAYSDLLDPTAFDLSTATVRFNSGEDDSLVGAAPYQGSRLAVFKTQSIYMLNNVGGDMSQISVDRLPTRIGCLARRSIAEIGTDLIWLAQGGVYRLSQTDQGAVRSEPIPASWAIEGTMQRINWRAASNACGVVAGRYYYLAVPLDGSDTNNAVLVYDVQTGQWQGYDEILVASTGEIAQIKALVVSNLWGRRVPFAVTADYVIALDAGGYCDSAGQGELDVNSLQEPVRWRLETRGYPLGGIGHKQLASTRLVYATQGATVNLDISTGGPNASRAILTNQTRDRTKYTRWGMPRFSLDNAGDDFADPHREDYQWQAGDAVTCQSGIPLNVFQEFDQGLAARLNGRYFSLAVHGSGGMRIKGVESEGRGETANLKIKS